MGDDDGGDAGFVIYTEIFKQEGSVSLSDGVEWPFSLIIGLIPPIKFVTEKCQTLQGICNHDSRKPPRAFFV